MMRTMSSCKQVFREPRKSARSRTRTICSSRAIRGIHRCTSNGSAMCGPSGSARRYRALGTEVEDGIVWVGIGTHDEYDKLVANQGLEGRAHQRARCWVLSSPRSSAPPQPRR
jgi:hypothetical protein